MYSYFFDITIYKQILRLRRSLNKSTPLGTAFLIYTNRMKSPYKKESVKNIIFKENSDREYYQFFCEVNSFYNALFDFEIKKGFSSEKYKHLRI